MTEVELEKQELRTQLKILKTQLSDLKQTQSLIRMTELDSQIDEVIANADHYKREYLAVNSQKNDIISEL